MNTQLQCKLNLLKTTFRVIMSTYWISYKLMDDSRIFREILLLVYFHDGKTWCCMEYLNCLGNFQPDYGLYCVPSGWQFLRHLCKWNNGDEQENYIGFVGTGIKINYKDKCGSQTMVLSHMTNKRSISRWSFDNSWTLVFRE